MAVLKCRHCGEPINSTSRRVQCPHCGQLFPFQCEVCQRNLRPPFPVFDDERHLTNDEENPLPLCDEHYLRMCPDCNTWYNAHTNPGYFRCVDCHEKALAHEPAKPVAEEPEEVWENETYEEADGALAMPVGVSPFAGANLVALVGAACAMAGLIGWFLTQSH